MRRRRRNRLDDESRRKTVRWRRPRSRRDRSVRQRRRKPRPLTSPRHRGVRARHLSRWPQMRHRHAIRMRLLRNRSARRHLHNHPICRPCRTRRNQHRCNARRATPRHPRPPASLPRTPCRFRRRTRRTLRPATHPRPCLHQSPCRRVTRSQNGPRHRPRSLRWPSSQPSFQRSGRDPAGSRRHR